MNLYFFCENPRWKYRFWMNIYLSAKVQGEHILKDFLLFQRESKVKEYSCTFSARINPRWKYRFILNEYILICESPRWTYSKRFPAFSARIQGEKPPWDGYFGALPLVDGYSGGLQSFYLFPSRVTYKVSRITWDSVL
jgi:hypothetical protein